MGIIFFTGYYYPKPSANGVCVHQVAKEYVQRGEQVFVICYQQSNEKKIEIIDGIKVYRICMPLYKRGNLYFENHQQSFLGKIAGKYGRFIGCVRKLLHIREYPFRDPEIVAQFIKQSEKLIEKYTISTIVAQYTPFEAIKAGEILKRRNPYLKIVYYSVDTLSNEGGYGLLPIFYRKREGLKRENYYFSAYDKLILMNCHKKHYMGKEFDAFKYKMYFSDFPLYKPCKKIGIKRKSFQIVYTGYLHKNLRNPRPALECLCHVLNKFTLHFYSRGDCDDIIEEYKKNYPNHIINHGFVTYNEAQNAIYNADILLSIGNANTEMVPSKIYEYISTGKFILHVYTYDKDPCLLILKKYGNSLCIKAGNKNFRDEITKSLDRACTIPTECIEKKFTESMPAYTVELIDNNNKHSK